MAIGTPTERYASATLVDDDHFTFSPTSTIAAGTTAIIVSAAVLPITAIADSVGNTWTLDHSYNASSTQVIVAASCNVTTAITTGASITLTYSLSGNAWRRTWVYEVSGLATSSRLDKSADASGSGANFSVGPTGSLSQADEVAFVTSLTDDAATITMAAGWTPATTNNLQTIQNLAYKIVADPAAITAAGTFNRGDRSWDGMLVTYKGLSTPPPGGGQRHLQRLLLASEGQTIVLGGR